MKMFLRPQILLLFGLILFVALMCGCTTIKNISSKTSSFLQPSFLAAYLQYVPHTVKVVRDIEYAQVDGRSLRLDIYSPKNAVGKLPVVVWIHAGGWDSKSKNPCPASCMATQNFAVVSINYRLSGAAVFPAQIYDCKGAIRWLRANAEKYNLDADHIGAFGASDVTRLFWTA
jgi:acetyl esterase/lipase